MIWVSLLALAALLILFFVVIPAFKGYGVYKAMKNAGIPEEYLTNMEAFAQAKSEAEGKAESAQSQLSACNNEREELQSSASSQQAEFDRTIDDCIADQEALKAERDEAQERNKEQEQAIADAGRRLCCIERVSDSSINGYAIENGKIVCVKDGGAPISC
jgi:hypothetical protein